MINSIKELLPPKWRKAARPFLSGFVNWTRRDYINASRVGGDSANAWIRKSSTIGGWIDLAELEFLWELATEQNEGNILEIGTWLGKSACIFAGACIENAPKTRVICIDPFTLQGTKEQISYHAQILGKTGSTFEQFSENATRLEFRKFVIPVPSFSFDSLPYIGSKLRLAFIDGAHDFENAKKDADLVIPMLQKGGVIAFHDVHETGFPDLVRLINEYIHNHPDLKFYKTVSSIAAFRKTC